MTPQTENELPEINKTQYEILCGLEVEWYRNSNHFPDIDKKVLLKEIKALREMGLVDFKRGLFTEEGETFGGGWAIVYKKQKLVREIIERFEWKNEKKYSEEEKAQAVKEERNRIREAFLLHPDFGLDYEESVNDLLSPQPQTEGEEI